MAFSSLIFLLIFSNIPNSSYVQWMNIAHYSQIGIAQKDIKRLDAEQRYISISIYLKRGNSIGVNLGDENIQKFYPDCQLKGQVLTSLLEQDRTVKEMHSIVQHPNFNAFKAEVSQLKRRGYLTVSEHKRPKRYKLTKKGVEHASDPFITIRRRQESLQNRVSQILNDDEAFAEALRIEVEKHTGGSIASGGSGGAVSKPSASVNDEQVIKVIRGKDDEIAKLQMQLQQMKRQSQSTAPTISKIRQQRQQTPEQINEENLRIKKRRKLAQMYHNRYLDADFFAKYGDLRPFKFKFKKWLSPNSIEVMSKNNPEIKRGHAHKKPIPANVIPQCQFRIVGVDEKGITITGHGLPDGKARMSF